MAKNRRTVSVVDELDAPTLPADEPASAPKARRYEGVHRTTLYLPHGVHQAMRRIAFDHNIKEHDIVMQGLDMVLQQRYGMPGIAELAKAKK